MERKTIYTVTAPAPIGPYSQAVQAGNMLFVSGNIALDTEGNLHMESLEAETEKVMENLRTILGEAGYDFSQVVKSTIFLTSMDFFTEVNQVYGRYFTENPPARETVAVAGLPKGVRVEISVIAVR